MKDRRPTLRKATLTFLAILGILAIPALAAAIPGSGEMVSIHSPAGRQITELYNVIGKICWVVLVLVETLLFYSIFKFRRRSDDERPAEIHGNFPLEMGLLVTAAVVQIYIGVITLDVMLDTEVMPETSMTVEAIAYQWGWQFRYPDQGGLLSDDLVIPAHTNIKLEVTSKDVIHSIFIPALGVKIDAVPGRFNYWWFNADGPVNQVLGQNAVGLKPSDNVLLTTRPKEKARLYGSRQKRKVTGLENSISYMSQSRKVNEGDVSPYAKYDAVEYVGMCTEICGKGHWNMYFRTVAMTNTSFQEWVKDKESGGGEVDGAAIYAAKCASCHAADGNGTPGTFPPLAGAKWANQEDMKVAHIEVVLKGSEAASLLGDTIVKGEVYTGAMQPWNEVLNDAEVAALVTHERVSWGNTGGEVSAKEVEEVRKALGLAAFPAGGGTPIPETDLITEGKSLFAACTTCHGTEGKGLQSVPHLANNPKILSDVSGTLSTLLKGQDTPKWPGAMTPMGNTMTDRQLAALMTYMRKSWGNEGSAVMPSEVKRLRSELK